MRARLEGIFHPQSGTPAFSAGVIWDPSPTPTAPHRQAQGFVSKRSQFIRRLQERPHFLPVSGFGATLRTQVPIFKATLFLSLTVLSPQPHSPPTTALERATLLKMAAAPVSHQLQHSGTDSSATSDTTLSVPEKYTQTFQNGHPPAHVNGFMWFKIKMVLKRKRRPPSACTGFLTAPGVFSVTDGAMAALGSLCPRPHPFVQSCRVIFFGSNELLQRSPATVAGNFFATSSDFTFSKLTRP